MPLRRLLQHFALALYIVLTLGGIWFTLLHRFPPLLPERPVFWTYTMMAPYQGDTPDNGELVAEGRLPGGDWTQVSLDRYFPHGFGEKNVRMYFRVFDDGTTIEEQRAVRTLFIRQVLERERAAGRPYESMRLFFDTWDRSPAGFQYLHLPAFTRRVFITEVQ